MFGSKQASQPLHISDVVLPISRAKRPVSVYNWLARTHKLTFIRSALLSHDGFVGGLNDMFDSLDEQMKHDMREQQSGKERMLIYTAVAIVSVVVFVGLYFAVRMME